MTDDDLARLNARLNQLVAQNFVQGQMIHRLLGLHALQMPDWRETLDDLRMMVEWTVKNLQWAGPESEGEAVRLEALNYLWTSLDELHKALVTAGPGGPPAPSNANPSSP